MVPPVPHALPGESEVLFRYVADHPELFRKITLDKGASFSEEGKVCPYFALVTTGILCHEIEIEGQPKTTYLALRNSFTTSLESFLNGTPSRKSIRALVASELRCISREDFRKLQADDENFRSAYFDLIQRQICLIDDYRIDLLTLTPEERYQKLLVTEPVLLRQIPLHHLASFLGISTRHMSRIRKSIG